MPGIESTHATMSTSMESPVSLGTVAALVAALAGSATWLYYLHHSQRPHLPLPPGPPEKSWLWGNAKDMPRMHQWLKFTEWAKTYGKSSHPPDCGQI